MPQIIRTPEQIFREEAKDIYFLRFHGDKGRNSPAWQEMQDWLKENVPQSRVEMLAPSEHSGWVSGYFGDLRVDFSEADLAIFCARWETPKGKSLDKRFQCYQSLYQSWFKKYGSFVPTNEAPGRLGLTVWWDTPMGLIYHQIGMEDANARDLFCHPADPQDIWIHAIQLWPALAGIDSGELISGRIQPIASGSQEWCVIYNDDPFTPISDARKSEILEWFGLPKGTRIENEW
jgi:hypothetical protein